VTRGFAWDATMPEWHSGVDIGALRLHVEVRQGGVAIDPTPLLPAP